jgi:hypothetical protein
MLTITHVLCPVDLSAAAADALRYATELSSVLQAELSVLLVGSGAPDGRSIGTVSRSRRYFVHPRRLEPI